MFEKVEVLEFWPARRRTFMASPGSITFAADLPRKPPWYAAVSRSIKPLLVIRLSAGAAKRQDSLIPPTDSGLMLDVVVAQDL